MLSILIQTISTPERSLWELSYSILLSLALFTLELGILGLVVVLVASGVDELLRRLLLLLSGQSGLFNLCHLVRCLLTSVIIDSDSEVIDSFALESIDAMAIDTSPSGTSPSNCSILCSPAASCSGDDFPSLFSLPSSSSSPISTFSPPSFFAEPLGTWGELATAYDSGAESSTFEEYPEGVDFDDHASDASSAYGEIPRGLYSNVAAVARWNQDTSRSLMELNADSDASDASSEYGLVSRDVYFDGYEAVYG